MRRRLWLLVCLCLLLTGCGKPEAPAHPKLILRYADSQPLGSPTAMAAKYFAQLVEEETNGDIAIRVYSNGTLGSERSAFEQVQFGGIDFTTVSLGTLVDCDPALETLQLPYLYENSDHMWRVLDGEIGQSFLESSQSTAGVVGLSWFDAGARSFYTREPVTSLEDFQGLTIRVRHSDLMDQAMEQLGAHAVQLPYEDVYSALQNGQIDGVESTWLSYRISGHYAVAPYVLQDEYRRLPGMQVMSLAALDKVSQVDEAYVAVLMEAAKESAVYERNLWIQQEQAAKSLASGLGCIVTELSRDELERFQAAIEPIYDSYSEDVQALIQKIKST